MLGDGRVRRKRHFTVGNGALLVVVDSGGPYWERVVVDETILVALEHFGMPYRLLDLAAERPTDELLNQCAGILLAQNRLGESLSLAESRMIAGAVENGAGLVNFDYDLRLCKKPLLEIFGFEGIGPHPYTTDSLRVRESGHYVTGLQVPGEFHSFDRMVTAISVEQWGNGVVPLAEGILGKDQLIYIRHLAPWSAFEPRNAKVSLFLSGAADRPAQGGHVHAGRILAVRPADLLLRLSARRPSFLWVRRHASPASGGLSHGVHGVSAGE